MNLYGLPGANEDGYFGSAAGPRGVGAFVAGEDMSSRKIRRSINKEMSLVISMNGYRGEDG